MRQLSIIFLLFFMILFGSTSLPSYSALSGGIDYSIPVDYSHLSEAELQSKALDYFRIARQLPDYTLDSDMTNALLLYSILQNKNPENVVYSMRLGILYDKLGKDRLAKGNLSRAISIDPYAAAPYFYFGEYYYKRQQYRQALRYYKKAQEYSTGMNSAVNYRLGDIYQKLGDTKSSLEHLKRAAQDTNSAELQNKIKRVEMLDAENTQYYKK